MVIHRCIVNHATRIRTKISVIEQVPAVQEENLVVKSLPGTSSGIIIIITIIITTPGCEKSSRHKLWKSLKSEVGEEGHVRQVVLVPWQNKQNKKTFLVLLIKIICTNDLGLDALSHFQVFHPVVGKNIFFCPAYCVNLLPRS